MEYLVVGVAIFCMIIVMLITISIISDIMGTLERQLLAPKPSKKLRKFMECEAERRQNAFRKMNPHLFDEDK